MNATKSNNDHSIIIRTTKNYLEESRWAKRDRMEKNKINFDTFHLRQDFSHKIPGQSREFLPKQAMAVEQITSFFQQGLIDLDEWFKVTPAPGVSNPMFSENEISLLLQRQLNKTDFYTVVGDAIKLGLLGSLMIAKVHGRWVKKPHYYTTEKFEGDRFKKQLMRADKKQWELRIDLIRQEDYDVDPQVGFRARPLYECQTNYLDMSEVVALSEGINAIYDNYEVEKLGRQVTEDAEQNFKKARETGQNQQAYNNFRQRVKVVECWGDILDPVTGALLHENVTWTTANDTFVLQEPKVNPFWHGESPFVASPIVRVPFSAWHKALMDAPTKLNISQNELFNLILDGGLMATHGIKQIRTDWLEDISEIENGIAPGKTLRVNSMCPPGAKVLERVDTATVGQDSLAVYNLTNSEFMQGALTNDLRMGTMPARAVKATEVVEASQTITSVFNGVAKVVEFDFITKILHKSWMTSSQHMDDLDSAEVQDLIGVDRAQALAAVAPEERFAQSATGHKFDVFGISSILGKMQDFRKFTSMLQTLSASQLLMEEFLKKYSVGKFLGEIMRSLNINTARIELGEEEKAQMAMSAQAAPMGGPQGPNVQSQIPQAAAGGPGTNIPQTSFPRGGLGG